MLLQALQWLEHSPIAAAVRGQNGWEWLFPIVETLHVISLGLVFGSILQLDLRLLGRSGEGSGVSQLCAEILPLTWFAFVAAAVTGSLMFVSRAQVYFYNPQFELKFLCIALAGINMAIFHLGIYRRVRDWEQGPTPAAARFAGAASITLWVSVIGFGRWIGFTT